MRPTFFAALLAAVTFTTAPACAQRANWPKEPEKVFGIKFGEPIGLDDMRECGAIRPDAPVVEKPISVCRMGSSLFDHVDLGAFPILEFRFGRLEIEDGRPTRLFMTAHHEDYTAVRSILVERYGRPTTREISEVRTKAGVPHKSEELTWIGRRLMLAVHELAGDVNTTSISFTYLPAAAAAAEQNRAATKRSASKL